MKRTTKPKPNKGPVNPRNRKEKKELSLKIIETCEKAIMDRIIDTTNKPDTTWEDVDKAYDSAVEAQKSIHPDHKGLVLIAAANVRKAYFKVKADMLKREGRI
ncbi:MAG: hypothetical protein WC482_04980 [Candidatus Omnitrophota bacterium]